MLGTDIYFTPAGIYCKSRPLSNSIISMYAVYNLPASSACTVHDRSLWALRHALWISDRNCNNNLSTGVKKGGEKKVEMSETKKKTLTSYDLSLAYITVVYTMLRYVLNKKKAVDL